VSRLKSVDLPTFGRPTMATSGSAEALACAATADLRLLGNFVSVDSIRRL